MSRSLQSLTVIMAAIMLNACSSKSAPQRQSSAPSTKTIAAADRSADMDHPSGATATPPSAGVPAATQTNLSEKDSLSHTELQTAQATPPPRRPDVTPVQTEANPPPAPVVPRPTAAAVPAQGVIADGETTMTPVIDEPVRPDGPAPTIATEEPANNRNQECALPYRRADADWFPGLPFPPADPRLTQGVDRLADGQGGTQSADELRLDPTRGLQYSDAARDNLMKAALVHAQKRNAVQQKRDRELALHINDVRVYTDINGNGRVQVSFNYDLGRGQAAEVTLEGQMRDRNVRSREGLALQQTQSGVTGQFTGQLNCMDANGGCQNTILTLQLLSVKGAVGREVQIVHRWSNAHITISDEDQFSAAQMPNRAHKALAGYLGNTANNSCLVALAAAKSGLRQLQPCAVEELQKICGEGRPRFPAARAFSLRTWAVAFGRAGFELAVQDKEAQRAQAAVNHFVISGPLVISQQRPMATDKLTVSNNIGVARADLIANDGSGDLNLQLVFSGAPKSHMRLNITSLTEPVRPELQSGASGAKIQPSWIK